MTSQLNILVNKALEARKYAYAPYSKYTVGACVLANDGAGHLEMFTGCNIENASYGLTICAERTAIFSAVSYGYTKLLALVCATEDGLGHSCGACLQVMAEFSDDYLPLISVNKDGNTINCVLLKDLLPKAFRLRV
jgi:cytidine deaminase